MLEFARLQAEMLAGILCCCSHNPGMMLGAQCGMTQTARCMCIRGQGFRKFKQGFLHIDRLLTHFKLRKKTHCRYIA